MGISDEARAACARHWPAILERLAAGDMVKDITRDIGISDDVLRAYRIAEPVAEQQWLQAKEASADSFFWEAVDAARSPITTAPDGTTRMRDPQHNRTLIDTLKWAARIRNPRVYSDKAQLDVNVRTLDLTRIISDAQARLIAARAERVIDAELVQSPAALLK